jgi:very-short-patch-repair endonuclease
MSKRYPNCCVLFTAFLRSEGLPAPIAEHRFHAVRKWRFDYAWPSQSVALEVEGGVWTRGRHVRPAGYLADMEKYNAAATSGWRVLRVEPSTLLTTATIKMLRAALTAVDQTIPIHHLKGS